MNTEKDQLSNLEQLYKDKKYAEFLKIAEPLVQELPHSFPINFLYGKVLLDLNQLNEAEEALSSLTELYPDNINLLTELGNLYIKLKNNTKALEYYNKILFLDPFNLLAKQAIENINKQQDQPAASQVQPSSPPPPPPPPEEEPVPEAVSKTTENKFEDTVNEEIFANGTPIKIKDDISVEVVDEVQPVEFDKGKAQPTMQTSQPGIESQDSAPVADPEETITKETEPLTPTPPVDSKPAPVEMAEESAAPPPKSEPQSLEKSEAASLSPPEPNISLSELEKAEAPEKTEMKEPTSAPAEEQVPGKQTEPDSIPAVGEDADFVTESAAQLYVSQGHYGEALKVYEQLFILKKDESLLPKIEAVKRKWKQQKKIAALEEFLKKIQKRSEELV